MQGSVFLVEDQKLLEGGYMACAVAWAIVNDADGVATFRVVVCGDSRRHFNEGQAPLVIRLRCVGMNASGGDVTVLIFG